MVIINEIYGTLLLILRGRILDKTPGQRQNLLISLPF